ncbi:hypothetical protein ABZ470_12015 [Streptosporangium sp. NPDC020072]|uniref:hypothetical protein n=1 Tax=Streptosporangium sp. NPDC020072 TaxID=3154788 RepID=UPI00341D3D94
MTGRHRDGLPYAPVYRRVWDGPARAEAERIDQAWADWTVLYSLGRRAFYAVAAWDGPRPVIVEDPTADGLEERMREAEMIRAFRLSPQSSPAPVRRRRGGTGRPPSGARNGEVGGERGSPGEETASAGGRSSPGASPGEGMVFAGGRPSPGGETVSAGGRSPGGRAA